MTSAAWRALPLLVLSVAPELVGSAQFYGQSSHDGDYLAASEYEQKKPAWQGFLDIWDSERGAWRGEHGVQAAPEVTITDDTRGFAKLTVYVALVLCLVPPLIAISLTYCLPPFLSKESTLRRYYGYLFLEHRNVEFAAHYELSVRGTIGVLLLALPFLLPQYKELIASGYYTSTAVMLFVFTLYFTVGHTINLAFEGVLGTLFAVLNIWIMHGIFPEGVHDEADGMVWWAGVTDGVLYILIIVGMDLDIGCKMFALNWHMYFWMDFLNPNVTGVYSSNWRIDIKGPAVSAVVQSCIGVGVAVLVTLLPFPLFALDKARDISLSLGEELSEAFDAGIGCFISETKNQLAETKFRHDIGALTSGVNNMGGYAAISWWECLGLPGKPQVARDFMCQLSSTVGDCYDRLVGLRHIIRVATPGPEHMELMGCMKPHLENLSKQTGDLLKTMISGAVDGSFDEDEKAKIADLKAKVIEAMATVTTEFAKKQSEMKAALHHQAAFCLAYCSYARIVLDFEKALQQNIEQGMFLDNLKTWAKRFTIPFITNENARNEWLRSSASILLCFYVGYRGYSAILPAYNAVPAATVSLLLSSGLTANFTKNLLRFQGVVLGIVFGQIAYALLGWCSTPGYIGVGIFLVIWSLATFIMYFDCVDNSLLGCLLAAFGIVGVLRGCSDKVFQAGGSYNTVVGVVVAITIKVLVDSALARARASEEATRQLRGAWDQLEKAINDFLAPEVTVITFQSGNIKAAFQGAAALSVDADKEPRLWWCPWKHETFVGVCDSGARICEAFSNLEAAFSKTGCDGGDKSSTLTVIQQLASSGQLKKDISANVGAIKELCFEYFSFNKDAFFAETYEVPKGICDFVALHKNVDEVTGSLLKDDASSLTKDEASGNLEYDVSCKIGVFYMTLDWVLEMMEDVKSDLLSK